MCEYIKLARRRKARIMYKLNDTLHKNKNYAQVMVCDMKGGGRGGGRLGEIV